MRIFARISLLLVLIPLAAHAASLENGSLYGGETNGSGGGSLPVLLGVGAPGTRVGQNGQEYIDTASKTIWVYDVTAWAPIYTASPVPPGVAATLAFNSATNSGLLSILMGF